MRRSVRVRCFVRVDRGGGLTSLVTKMDDDRWPRLSPDGSKLVYVALDAVSGDNKLMISHSDGSNPQEISLTGLPSNKIYDTPVFTPRDVARGAAAAAGRNAHMRAPQQ